jgi:hypothetical protein
MTLNQSSNHTQPLKPKLSWEAFCLGGWKDLRAAGAERFDWRGDGEIAGHLTGGIFWLKIRYRAPKMLTRAPDKERASGLSQAIP